MLTQQSGGAVAAESSSHIEAIPINLIASEDGRTLLAMTAPITLVGQNGTAASLVDVKNLNGNLILHSPVFQISLEDIVGGAELEQAENFQRETDSSEECAQAKDKKAPMEEHAFASRNTWTVSEKEDEGCAQKSRNAATKKSTPGRPKKGATICSQGTDGLRCDICQERFTKQTSYRKHMENHAEEKPHRCPKCSASFNVPTNFTLHMATHNTGEPKCPECGKKFARMASLKSHMLLHEKEENLFCTECEDAFSTKAQLDAHLKLHGEKWTAEEARKCKLCSKQFGQPALYRLHIREHYRLQTKIAKQTKRGTKHKTMNKCTICLKSFQKPSQLMRHIRVHTGEKPFKCTVCGRAFTQKSSLQIHTWQHNGIRPHACQLCNAKFSQKGNLNAHVTRVHNVPEGEPIYGCNYCSCVFKKLGSLNGHMKRMHSHVNEENPIASANATECDIRATVDTVMTQLACLQSEAQETPRAQSLPASALPETTSKRDILQQALKNSGLPSKNKAALEGTSETNKQENRTNFVTLLDRAPDGGTRKYLTIKQRCVGNVRWYACNFCHKEFKKPSDLIRHLRVHTQEKPFKCTYCYRSFALKSTMIAHQRTHSSVKRYACGFCDKTFLCHGSLVGHAKSHEAKLEDGSTRCVGNQKNGPAIDAGSCSSGQSKAQQPKGKLNVSLEAESLVPRVILQEPLLISDAGNKICVAQVASKERRAYDGDPDPARPHKCWVCQATFTKISHLKQHHRRHTGERPYKCSKCDRRFTSNSVLKSHLHTHEDSRPYGCSICNAKFSTQSSMKRHLVTHSNKRPFMCPYCHKTFKTYVNCRKHMKIHKYELAQRQLEQEKMRLQEEGSDKAMSKESCKEEAALASCDSAAASNASVVATSTASPFADTLALSRLGSVELSFQPQLSSEFSQALAEFQAIAGEKEKARAALPTSCDAATFINENVSEIAVMNLEHSQMQMQMQMQMLQGEEGGSVALPVYSGDQTLTPESIRDIEETLNQQFFNIGMNLSLASTQSRHPSVANPSEIGQLKEQEEEQQQQQQQQQQQRQQQQQTVLNVMYGSGNAAGANATGSVEPTGHVFSTQLDSFEIDHIALQSDAEIDIGLDTSTSTSMASILPRSVKEEQHRLSVCVATPDASDERSERCNMQAVVFISQENFAKREAAARARSRIEEPEKNASQQQATIDPILFTEQYRATPVATEVSEDATEPIKPAAGKSSRGESLLQCHMCSEQGFTAIGLKEHLTSHRGTKEYRCTECPSTFCTNGGLNRHWKVHADKQPSSEKQANDKTDPTIGSPTKIHDPGIWNCACPGVSTEGETCALPLEAQLAATSQSHSALRSRAIDQDSSVSEKVLLDTFAEKEVMDRVESALVEEKKERKEYTNKCKFCPKTFRKPSDLIRHLRTHTGERPYKCDYCSKSFAVKCTLDSHTKVHTGTKTFRCHVCSSLFATKGSLKVHMRLHTGSKPFRCPICDSRFRTSGHRKVHLSKHAREQKESPKRKQKHMKVAAVAEVAANLEKRHAKEEEARDSKQELAAEVEVSQAVSAPAPAPAPVPAPAPAPALACHFEGYSIETAACCLSDQMNFDTDAIISNNNQAIVSINESNQLVTNLHFLLTNGLVTIQTEESLLPQASQPLASLAESSQERATVVADSACSSRPLQVAVDVVNQQPLKASPSSCLLPLATPQIHETSTKEPLAEKASPAKSGAGDRAATRGGNSSKKEKECDICGKTFTKPYQVERHKRIHTGERPYKCQLCTKSFAQKSTLQMHQKHHTGDRPYACLYCEYSFTQKGNLRTHVKRVHQLDTMDARKWKLPRQSLVPKSSLQEHAIQGKALNLEDIPFVEFLK